MPHLRFVTEDRKTGHKRPLTPPTTHKRGALSTDASQLEQRQKAKTDSEAFPSSLQNWYLSLFFLLMRAVYLLDFENLRAESRNLRTFGLRIRVGARQHL